MSNAMREGESNFSPNTTRWLLGGLGRALSSPGLQTLDQTGCHGELGKVQVREGEEVPDGGPVGAQCPQSWEGECELWYVALPAGPTTNRSQGDSRRDGHTVPEETQPVGSHPYVPKTRWPGINECQVKGCEACLSDLASGLRLRGNKSSFWQETREGMFAHVGEQHLKPLLLMEDNLIT